MTIIRTQVTMHANSGTTRGKFYTGAVVEDGSTYWVVFNWGAGAGTVDMDGGQSQVDGAYSSESAAMFTMNNKLQSKVSRGYFTDRTLQNIAASGTIRTLINAAGGAKLSAGGAVPPSAPKPVAKRTTAKEREAAALKKLDAQLGHATATLLVRELDSKTVGLIVEEREHLDERRTTLQRQIDQIDVQISALNAKLTS
jgi:hypothetical protein